MKKILIVDDQLEVRELVEVTLRIGDYEILQAENGEQALALARSQKPDLILLDVMMPGSDMDGIEVCRQLKGNPETARIQVVMLTAKSQETDVNAAKEAGADEYFSKPFSPLELMRKVEEILT